MKSPRLVWAVLLGGLLLPALLSAQDTRLQATDSLSLEQSIAYALENQPRLQQSELDEAIGEREIRAQLSGWLPQANLGLGYTHHFQLQTSVIGDQAIQLGTKNNSSIQLQLAQVLFNNDLLLSSRAARYTRRSLSQSTSFTRINTVVEVSKAFYNVILTQEQLRILDENISRLQKQYQDALSQYESGIVDKTDYQRASIALANTRSDRKRTLETITARKAYLKQLMGYPPDKELHLDYSYAQMQQQAQADTTQAIRLENRIEYQLLHTEQQLLSLNTSAYRWGFLPSVSAFYNNSRIFLHDDFSQLYQQAYPTSAIGLQVNIPLFQGTRRIQNLRRAQLLEQRLQLELETIRNSINTEYQTALASYKSDYYEWQTQEQNVATAREVYDVIKLQYDEGIKTYLDLIVAETDLRAAQINYYNALNQLLASKLDLQRALGDIPIH